MEEKVFKLGYTPLFHVSTAFISGIFCALQLPFHFNNVNFWWWFSALFCLFLASNIWIKKHPFFLLPAKISMLLLFALLGLQLAYYAEYTNRAADYSKIGKLVNIRKTILIVKDACVSRNNNWRTYAEISAVNTNDNNKLTAYGGVVLYFPKRAFVTAPKLQYGDTIVVTELLKKLPGAATNGGFDFRKMMRFKNIAYRGYVKPNSFEIRPFHGFSLVKKAKQVSANLELQLISEYGKSTGGVLASLMFGAKENLDKTDVAAFTNTGTIHILAVSGMHIALIYASLLFLFNLIKKNNRKKKIITAIIILLGIWSYAFLAGLGASIIRATVMCSIAEIGRNVLCKKGYLLNTVFASAFLQLCFDPLQILDIGFQLSYMAVLGILVFNEPIQRIWAFKFSSIQAIWNLSAVCIAATLGTIPLTLYHFHFFPIWFLLTNLLIVPLSTFLIYLGILGLITISIPGIRQAIKFIILHMTEWMTGIAKFFERLDGNFHHIPFNIWHMVLLYGAITMLGFYIWYFQKKKLWWWGGLVCLVLFSWTSPFSAFFHFK